MSSFRRRVRGSSSEESLSLGGINGLRCVGQLELVSCFSLGVWLSSRSSVLTRWVESHAFRKVPIGLKKTPPFDSVLAWRICSSPFVLLSCSKLSTKLGDLWPDERDGAFTTLWGIIAGAPRNCVSFDLTTSPWIIAFWSFFQVDTLGF